MSTDDIVVQLLQQGTSLQQGASAVHLPDAAMLKAAQEEADDACSNLLQRIDGALQLDETWLTSTGFITWIRNLKVAGNRDPVHGSSHPLVLAASQLHIATLRYLLGVVQARVWQVSQVVVWEPGMLSCATHAVCLRPDDKPEPGQIERADKAIRLLAAANADVNAIASCGSAPLGHAVHFDYWHGIVPILTSHGASVNLADDNGIGAGLVAIRNWGKQVEMLDQ